MGIRISQLPEATTVSLSEDYFPFIQDNITKRVSLDKLNISPSGSSGYTLKSSAFDAIAGTKYAVDTTSATVAITFPASPTIGDSIVVLDAEGTFATHNSTIIRNGKKIDGVADNLTLNINGAEVELVYVGGSKEWQLVRIQ